MYFYCCRQTNLNTIKNGYETTLGEIFTSVEGVIIDSSAVEVTVTGDATVTKNETDFTFLYLGYTDMAGHCHGWMSEEYMNAMENSFANISKLYNSLPDDYVIIVTADHGGHDRTHGTELDEDMIIPMMVLSKKETADFDFTNASIKDVAPTVVSLLGVEPDEEWEGKPLLK